MAWIAVGFSLPWKRDIIAEAGSPGMSRGMKKLTVIAAQRVSTKKPSRCSRYLMTDPSCSLPAAIPGGALLLGRQVQEDLLLVRDLPRRRQRVLVVLRRPPGERAGVVLVPL